MAIELGRLVRGLLAVGITVDVIAIALYGMRFVTAVEPHPALSLGWERLQGALALATIVAVLLWLYTATAMLWRAGAPGLRFSPLRAVATFFVPVLNFYQPMLAVAELHNASRALAAHEPPRSALPGPVRAWWIAWLCCCGAATLFLLSQASAAATAAAAPDLRASAIQILFAGLTIVAAWLLMRVVALVGDHLSTIEAQAAELRGGGGKNPVRTN